YSSSSIRPAPLSSVRSGHIPAPRRERTEADEHHGVAAENETTLPPFEGGRGAATPEGERIDARAHERVGRGPRQQAADLGAPLPERGAEAQERLEELREREHRHDDRHLV